MAETDITKLAQSLKAAAEKAEDNFDPNMFVQTRDILALVESLPQPQQPVTLDPWIPVSKRMPEKGQRVLICIDFDSTMVPRLVKDAEYTGSTFRVGPNTVNTDGEPRVTHWREVPELPPQQNNEPPVSKLVNDVTVGKPLTITLPDISSKAFWSGQGKTEVFHPETYKRWVKEAIERYCAIARVEVEVK